MCLKRLEDYEPMVLWEMLVWNAYQTKSSAAKIQQFMIRTFVYTGLSCKSSYELAIGLFQ